MCGFVCLWRAGDAALARRMIDRIAHRGPDELRVSQLPRRARGDGALPPRDHRARGRDAADLARRRCPDRQWRDLQLRGSAGDPGRGERSRRRATARPSSICSAPPVAALDRPARRHVRVCAGDARARDRGARPARHQADLRGASRRRPGLRFRAQGVRRPGPARGPGDRARHAVRQRGWRAALVPHAARALPKLEPGGAAEPIWRELRLVLEEAVKKWLVADVEVGAFLSGGLNSSIIAALAAARQRSARSRPSRSASRAAPIWSPRARSRPTSAASIASSASPRPTSPRSCRTSSITWRAPISTWCAAPCRPTSPPTLARRHVKAVLTGEGADELFAGYAYHHGYAGRPRALADDDHPLARHHAQHQPAARRPDHDGPGAGGP